MTLKSTMDIRSQTIEYYPATSIFASTTRITAGTMFTHGGGDVQWDNTANSGTIDTDVSGTTTRAIGMSKYDIVKIGDRALNNDFRGDQIGWLTADDILDTSGTSGGIRKVTFITEGTVVTNQYTGTPGVGDVAYLANDGQITNWAGLTSTIGTGDVNQYDVTPRALEVGTFRSGPVSSYVKVQINL